jgi:hypothetical protein
MRKIKKNNTDNSLNSEKINKVSTTHNSAYNLHFEEPDEKFYATEDITKELKSDKIKLNNLNEEELLQGIIIAEILGNPLSKRQKRRRTYR